MTRIALTKTALIGASIFALAAPAGAATIEFTFPNGVFDTAFTVNGYTVTPGLTGPIEFDTGGVTTLDSAFQSVGDFTITKDGGGLFSLTDFEFFPTSGDAPFYTLAGSTGGPFSIFGGAGTPLAGLVSVNSGQYSAITFSLFSSEGLPVGIDNINLSAAAVPEPATWAMMVLGIAAAGVTLRVRRRKEEDAIPSMVPAIA